MLWHSNGEADGINNILPKTIKPLVQPKEEKLILTLIEELRSKLALDFERGLGPQSRVKQVVDFLIVGSSNASKLTKPLSERGYSTSLIYAPNWRIGSDSVSSLAQQVAAAVADVNPDVVVLQLLDNSCYYGRTRDGSRTAPKKGDDGKFHLEGDVSVCSHDTQLEHLKAISGIKSACSSHRSRVLSGSGTLLEQEVPGLQTAPAELFGASQEKFQGFPLL
jgi:hypothetical protein